ncbi:unnamed protein product [Paramecium primaurelia]|uniref:Uncharacterized protein n=1 Tax=Paramecium primaurelia TaxID=5886 RepID=A0A8S1QCV7_PARPR|nr:unnamed protein product [Paramecium primaurelia]
MLQDAQSQLNMMQEEINLIFTNVKDVIKSLSDYFSSGDMSFQNFLNKNEKFMKFSTTELNFQKDFLERNKFVEQTKSKEILASLIEKAGIIFSKIIQNAYKANYLIEQIQEYYINEKIEENIEVSEGLLGYRNRLIKKQFNLLTQKNGDQVFIKDGQILGILQKNMGSVTGQVRYNLEKIKYLQFQGQFGIKGYRIKQWIYYWKGLQVGGGYYNLLGQKEGEWVDLTNNYWDFRKIVEKGSYKQGKRVGVWYIHMNNQVMIGGSYDEKGNGLKNGKWTDIADGYQQYQELTYNGEYLNGKKIGKWVIKFRDQTIGGGSYDDKNKGIKTGKWIEISDNFNNLTQILYNGEYINGIKVDRWDSFINGQFKDQKQYKFGGGSYDNKCWGLKTGYWVEKLDGYSLYDNLISNGQYKIGKKFGKWEIRLKNEVIGGGFYDSRNFGIKVGNWVETNNQYSHISEITYLGEYWNGRKVGRWKTNYQKNQVGGGSFDQGGNEVKIGKWIEIHDGYRWDSYVTSNGEYKNGKKFGFWDIKFMNKSIGGGLYHEGIKNGMWVDIVERFCDDLQITYSGMYKQDRKVGKWDTKFRNYYLYPFQLIGTGQYDEEGKGMKIGNWVEISDNYERGQEVIYSGKYENGKKVGNWDILFHQFETMKIGGGRYDEGGNGIKIGNWIDISDTYGTGYNKSQVIYHGEYSNGKKVGRWDIKYRKYNNDSFLTMGGGCYDEEGQGLKNGFWIEINDGFQDGNQITFNGEYIQGKKVGRWDIKFSKYISAPFLLIGGGSYDEEGRGLKIGKWIDIQKGISIYNEVIFEGVYKNGIKIGRWLEISLIDNEILSDIQYDN